MLDIDSILCELSANGDEFDDFTNSIYPEDSYNEIFPKFREFARNLVNPIWNNVNKWSFRGTDSENRVYVRSKLAIGLVRFEEYL